MIMKNNFKNKKKDKTNKEIRFINHSVLVDAGFTSKYMYTLFKRKYNRFFILSTNTKTFNLKIKQLRSKFKANNNLGLLVGFYHAI